MKIWIEIDDSKLSDVKKIIGEAAPEAEGKGKVREIVQKEEEAPATGETAKYDEMTSKDLYKLCCERGISSKCKKRDKASLIAVLRENDADDAAEQNTEEVEAEEEGSDGWGDEGEAEPEDPYVGKTARELYKMCVDRGLEVKKKQSPEVYVKMLRKDDEDEWNID